MNNWKVEKYNDYVYRLYSDTYKTTPIYINGADIKISEYYLVLPNNASEEDIEKVLSEINRDAGKFITTASISIEYMNRLDILRETASKIIITDVRREFYHSEHMRLRKEFSDKLRPISKIVSLITPYRWRLDALYDKTTVNGVDILVSRSQRVFILKMI